MMKKISFLVLFFIFSVSIAQSAIDTSLCAQPPYNVSSKFSQVMSKITGANFIATTAVENLIKSQLKKELGASGTNIDITPYSLGDLNKGKFKSLTINIPSAASGEIAFSNFKAQSLCEFNHIIDDKKEIKFPENFLMSFSADFTNTDLQKVTSSQQYIEKLSKVKVKIGRISLLSVTEPSVTINSGKLQMSFGLDSPLLVVNKLDKITISSKLKAQNGKLKLANMTINNTKYDLGLLLPIINMVNPLSLDTKIANNMGIAQIENVDIINDKISVNGLFYIPKNTTLKK